MKDYWLPTILIEILAFAIIFFVVDFFVKKPLLLVFYVATTYLLVGVLFGIFLAVNSLTTSGQELFMMSVFWPVMITYMLLNWCCSTG